MFKSYLENCERKLKININANYSNLSNLICGAPQGPFIGPLLFLLYINDVPQIVVSDSLPYTDDTCILFQRKNVNEIDKQLLTDFPNLCDNEFC